MSNVAVCSVYTFAAATNFTARLDSLDVIVLCFTQSEQMVSAKIGLPYQLRTMLPSIGFCITNPIMDVRQWSAVQVIGPFTPIWKTGKLHDLLMCLHSHFAGVRGCTIVITMNFSTWIVVFMCK